MEFHCKAYAMVRRTAIVELNSDWLNCFTRTRGSGLGHPHWVFAKHSKIATAFCPIPGVGDRDWEWSRPNQMAVTICASGQRRFAENILNKIDKMDSKFFFEMSFIVVEAIR